MRLCYCITGIALVFLALLGAFLPLLPTTPFLILAAMCFTRGSPRLHEWLMHHRILGPYIQDWENHRVVPLKAKVLATLMISISTALVIERLQLTMFWCITLILTMGYVCVYICSFASEVGKPEPKFARILTKKQ